MKTKRYSLRHQRRLSWFVGFPGVWLALAPAGVVRAEPDTQPATQAIVAEPAVEEPAEVPLGLRAAWDTNWRFFADNFIPFEDDFIGLPTWDAQYPSSTNLTLALARDKLREEYTVRRGMLSTRMYRYAPNEEAEAYATTLPSLEVGAYGRVDSVEVVSVLGPQEMLVTNVWLLDEQALDREQEAFEAKAKRKGVRLSKDDLRMEFQVREALAEVQDDPAFLGEFRLVGFSTRGLTEGKRYEGPRRRGLEVAVAKVEPVGEGRKTRLVLLPYRRFDRTALDEREFRIMLQRRGMTPEEFIQQLRAARELDADTADRTLMTKLLPPLPGNDD